MTRRECQLVVDFLYNEDVTDTISQNLKFQRILEFVDNQCVASSINFSEPPTHRKQCITPVLAPLFLLREELKFGNIGQPQETRMMGTTRPRKKFDIIFSRLNTKHKCDRQTDRQTDTGRQQRPRSRMASRG